MKLHDFITHMRSYSVCYHRDDYHRTHREVESFRNHAEYFEFELQKPNEVNISVYQTDGRFFKTTGGYEYSHTQVILLKREGQNQYKYIGNLLFLFFILL